MNVLQRPQSSPTSPTSGTSRGTCKAEAAAGGFSYWLQQRLALWAHCL
ncbi:hypothetical protein ACDW_40910 [Acidovorax sp. DW039]|nr:hypothetical protein ACDW_40910 [Acidovorax sp. DW039]